MKILNSLLMAFSMFSCIRVPPVEWKSENMKTALAFFPLIGFIIGICMWGATLLCELLSISILIRACLLTLIPIIISGGIHLDGFCDTCDALASCATTEKKHEILKDSHIGTFAVIWLIAYFLLTFALYANEFSSKQIYFLCLIPVFSRITSAFASILFLKYNGNGLLKTFTDSASKKSAVIILAILAVCTLAAAFMLSIHLTLVTLLAICISLIYVFFMSKKQFGGMSGDIAGFLLVITETAILLFTTLSGRIFL